MHLLLFELFFKYKSSMFNGKLSEKWYPVYYYGHSFISTIKYYKKYTMLCFGDFQREK